MNIEDLFNKYKTKLYHLIDNLLVPITYDDLISYKELDLKNTENIKQIKTEISSKNKTFKNKINLLNAIKKQIRELEDLNRLFDEYDNQIISDYIFIDIKNDTIKEIENSIKTNIPEMEKKYNELIAQNKQLEAEEQLEYIVVYKFAYEKALKLRKKWNKSRRFRKELKEKERKRAFDNISNTNNFEILENR
jgi:hypothetical protein